MAAPAAAATFDHEALVYDGLRELVARTAAFVREGIARGEPVMVAMTADKLGALRDALGADAAQVDLVDMASVGRNPSRIIPAWHRFLTERSRPGAPVRGVGEPIWAGRSPDELVECQRHEALLNVAFADRAGFRLLCPYDAGTLGPDVLHEARCSHPVVVQDGVRAASHEFRQAVAGAEVDDAPLPPPTGRFDVLGIDRATLAEARALVARRAAEEGLDPARARDLVLAVNEAATNSIRHGLGSGVLRVWRTPSALVCEVRDRGHVRDPLAGRHVPGFTELSGRGLWIVNQVCDLVQLRSGPSGTALRMSFALV
jgi:anti-sigma regulatory factor (Ser/Thr protein kinase)